MKFVRVRAAVLAGAVGAVLAGAGVVATTADAQNVDPGPYVVGNSVYFNTNGLNCSVGPDGSAGCDVAPPGVVMMVSLTGMRGQTYPVPYVPAVVVDNSGLPAHPDWTGGNKHTLPGGNPPLAGQPFNPPTITWAGTVCFGSYSVQMGCFRTVNAHGFYAGGGQVDGF